MIKYISKYDKCHCFTYIKDLYLSIIKPKVMKTNKKQKGNSPDYVGGKEAEKSHKEFMKYMDKHQKGL